MNRREYIRNYQRNWVKKRRLEWIEANGPCKKCGSTERLEVDHINPEDKSVNPKELWSRQKHIRDEELKKCQVLCEPCHQAKSNIENSIRNKGVPRPERRIYPDSIFLEVIELNKHGMSLRKACKAVGLKYGTFSRVKSRKERFFS